MKKKKVSQLKEFYHSHLLDNVMQYWVKSDLIDKENGGYITSVDREGKAYNNDS